MSAPAARGAEDLVSHVVGMTESAAPARSHGAQRGRSELARRRSERMLTIDLRSIARPRRSGCFAPSVAHVHMRMIPAVSPARPPASKSRDIEDLKIRGHLTQFTASARCAGWNLREERGEQVSRGRGPGVAPLATAARPDGAKKRATLLKSSGTRRAARGPPAAARGSETLRGVLMRCAGPLLARRARMYPCVAAWLRRFVASSLQMVGDAHPTATAATCLPLGGGSDRLTHNHLV